MQPEPPSEVYKHDVFISYSRKNEAFAAKLEQALESYRPPKGLKLTQRYLQVFRDKEDFTGGDYHQSLDRHLKESAKLIVICSPAARQSQYVNDEIRRFAQRRGADQIIPILFSGIPNNEAKPGQEAEMAFPEALCELMEMPLAINYLGLEASRDKVNKGAFSDAWHSTLADIYGISRSEVEQREKKRRARTRRIAFSVLSGSVAVLSVMLVFALVSRKQAVAASIEAEKQKDAAVIARGAEEKERKRAEAQELVARGERDKAVEAERLTGEALARETIAKNQAEERRKEADRQRYIAEQQTLIAEERARLATARQFAAQAISATEETSATSAYGTAGPERGVLLALESLKRFQTTEGTNALRRAIARLTNKANEIKFKEGDEVSSLSLSPDGNSLAIVQNGKAFLRYLSRPPSTDWLIPVENPQAVIFSRDGSKLALFREDSTLIWEVAAQKQVHKLPPIAATIASTLNSDGSQLLALNKTGLDVWDVSSATVRQIKPQQASWVTAGVSSGGEWLAARDEAGLIQIIEVSSGREIGRTRNKDIYDLFLSHDGKLLATSRETGVDVWRVEGWRRIATGLPHEWQVHGMAFSSDSRWLSTVTAKVSMDASDMGSTSLPGSAIRVWDLNNQRLVMHVSLAEEGGFAHGGYAFTANGDRLVTVTPNVIPQTVSEGSIETDGTKLLTWILSPTDLSRTACSLITRNLSESEWRTFMRTEPYRLTCPGLPVPEE